MGGIITLCERIDYVRRIGGYKMNYENVIELDNVTVGDCLDWYHMLNGHVVINDAHIINFVKE